MRKEVAIHEMGVNELFAYKNWVHANWHMLEGRLEVWKEIKKREYELHGVTSYTMRGTAMKGYLQRRKEDDAKRRGHRP